MLPIDNSEWRAHTLFKRRCRKVTERIKENNDKYLLKSRENLQITTAIGWSAR